MGSFSIWHWLIVLVVVLLVFGRGKIPELMGDMAKGIKSFKKGMSDDEAAEDAQHGRASRRRGHEIGEGKGFQELIARQREDLRYGLVCLPLSRNRAMFDIGWTEMLVIAVVMIVVVGPKDLPKMLRTFGKTTAKLRSMAGDFQKQFNEALKEAELDDVKKSVDSLRSLNPADRNQEAAQSVREGRGRCPRRARFGDEAEARRPEPAARVAQSPPSR